MPPVSIAGWKSYSSLCSQTEQCLLCLFPPILPLAFKSFWVCTNTPFSKAFSTPDVLIHIHRVLFLHRFQSFCIANVSIGQQVAQLLESSVKNAIATLLLSPKATLKNSGWVPMCGAQYRGGKTFWCVCYTKTTMARLSFHSWQNNRSLSIVSLWPLAGTHRRLWAPLTWCLQLKAWHTRYPVMFSEWAKLFAWNRHKRQSPTMMILISTFLWKISTS